MAVASQFILSGAFAGLVSCVALQPLDLIKTRLQQQQQQQQQPSVTMVASSPSASRPWHRIPLVHTAASVVQADGVRGLWRGTTPSVLRNGPGIALYFVVLEDLRARLNTLAARPAVRAYLAAASAAPAAAAAGATDGLLTRALRGGDTLINGVSGVTARGLVSMIMMPVSVVKVRYESSWYRYPSMAHAASDIMATNGVRGFFAGAGATVLRDAPYSGLYLMLYEQLRRGITAASGSGTRPATTAVASPPPSPASTSRAPTPRVPDPTLVVNLVSAGLSSVLATAVTQPFDLLRCRQQLQNRGRPVAQHAAGTAAAAGSLGARLRHTLPWAMVALIRQDGVRVMFAGILPRLLRKGLSSAITWALYEESLKWLERT
ncbi:hypothetical protein CXG81DRAFT_29705 [Caulochytrium protostelioides]|uniref:Mitochondrial glycine transporter n=1 Tax=Caulochytrium protostelioides TaxID=1555241 RepID=A0A4P9X8L3_9FUNG|nr:hypothetical protein CXG81DRAFT_29705 [Caulochytrium protostelioides]|eukprot:RKP01647.1 hypothetical protein CXG81DRAFT_29705 [Caulochytrium protostelioides]